MSTFTDASEVSAQCDEREALVDLGCGKAAPTPTEARDPLDAELDTRREELARQRRNGTTMSDNLRGFYSVPGAREMIGDGAPMPPNLDEFMATADDLAKVAHGERLRPLHVEIARKAARVFLTRRALSVRVLGRTRPVGAHRSRRRRRATASGRTRSRSPGRESGDPNPPCQEKSAGSDVSIAQAGSAGAATGGVR